MPYLILIVVLLFGGMFTGGYLYYKDTQSTIALLEKNNAALKVADETNKKTIDVMKTQVETSNKLSRDLTKKLNKSEEQRNDLIETFSKHDLTRDALKKPGLIEKIINNGTKKVFADLESDTTRPVSDGVQ